MMDQLICYDSGKPVECSCYFSHQAELICNSDGHLCSSCIKELSGINFRLLKKCRLARSGVFKGTTLQATHLVLPFHSGFTIFPLISLHALPQPTKIPLGFDRPVSWGSGFSYSLCLSRLSRQLLLGIVSFKWLQLLHVARLHHLEASDWHVFKAVS